LVTLVVDLRLPYSLVVYPHTHLVWLDTVGYLVYLDLVGYITWLHLALHSSHGCRLALRFPHTRVLQLHTFTLFGWLVGYTPQFTTRSTVHGSLFYGCLSQRLAAVS